MVQVNDVFYDIQSDTSARLIALGLEERLEDTLLILLADTYAIITHADAQVLTIGVLATR